MQNEKNKKVALITGGARRVGATIARALHAQGLRVIIHYRTSADEASALCAEFNKLRPDSALSLPADLDNLSSLSELVQTANNTWGRLDVLINNASSFYPTPIGSITELQWNELLNSNLKAPFFLSQAAAPLLTQSQGCIINLIDIRAYQPLNSYAVYSIAKAGLLMLTKTLAKELAPAVRVNAIAPGVVQWPDTDNKNKFDAALCEKIIARTPLKRIGTPQDIANAAVFLVQHADYMTGQTLIIDGGRLLQG